MKFAILLFLLMPLPFLSPVLLAQNGSAQQLFMEGNTAFQNDQIDTAMQKWKEAADLGYAPAQSMYGLAHMEGVVQPDLEVAHLWMERAAHQGDVRGMYYLGVFYENGTEFLEKDLDEAMRWYKRSAEEGYTDSYMAIAALYLLEDFGRDEDLALEWIRKPYLDLPDTTLAGFMERRPFYMLANHYLKQDNIETAINMFYTDLSGQAGDAEALLQELDRLGIDGNMRAFMVASSMYENGLYVEKDMEEATRWKAKAAEYGHIPAMNLLAEHYLEQDQIGEALPYLRQAADLGDSYSGDILGNLYWKGEGVPKDLEQAAEWLEQTLENDFYWPALRTLGSVNLERYPWKHPDWNRLIASDGVAYHVMDESVLHLSTDDGDPMTGAMVKTTDEGDYVQVDQFVANCSDEEMGRFGMYFVHAYENGNYGTLERKFDNLFTTRFEPVSTEPERALWNRLCQ